MPAPHHLLCVCTGNTCRSPMLSTLVRAALANAGRTDVRISSAGTGAQPDMAASSGAIAAMQRRGLSLAAHRSRPLDDIDLNSVSKAYCMTPTHALALRRLGLPENRIVVVNAVAGGVPDPWGGNDAQYEACAQVLEFAARDIVLELP